MISVLRPLILGSRSPRRVHLLEELDIPFVARPVSIDESPREGESPRAYVERVTNDKLEATSNALRATGEAHGGLLAADTVVVLDGRILGKPCDEGEAYRMVSSLSGGEHEVLTSYAFRSNPTAPVHQRIVSTSVRMRAASEGELRAYAATGEGLDKAGAYGIQGRGAFLIETIRGSYTNVVGLPLCELVLDMKEKGLLGNYP